MTIALKKTITKRDGGVYADAIHRPTSAQVTIQGAETSLTVKMSMFKDLATALDADGKKADGWDWQLPVDMADEAVATAFTALLTAILAQAKLVHPQLADAEDISVPE